MSQARTVRMEYGETRLIQNQYAAVTEKRGTTVSSSAWEFSGTGTLSGAALATPLASVKLAALTSGELKNTATLANGEIVITLRTIVVRGQPVMDYQ